MNGSRIFSYLRNGTNTKGLGVLFEGTKVLVSVGAAHVDDLAAKRLEHLLHVRIALG
jgi:hypothetical protein